MKKILLIFLLFVSACLAEKPVKLKSADVSNIAISFSANQLGKNKTVIIYANQNNELLMLVTDGFYKLQGRIVGSPKFYRLQYYLDFLVDDVNKISESPITKMQPGSESNCVWINLKCNSQIKNHYSLDCKKLAELKKVFLSFATPKNEITKNDFCKAASKSGPCFKDAVSLNTLCEK